MKKIVTITLAMVLFLSIVTDYAHASECTNRSFFQLDGGYYIETFISDTKLTQSPFAIFATGNTITKTKTSLFKDASGNTLWQVSITGTFEYNGITSKCTSCSHSASSSSAWIIESSSSYKSGNTATANATAKVIGVNGISQSYSRSVTIKCDANGNIS